MMNRTVKSITFLLFLLPLTSIAHHSFEVFDRSNPIQISGEVREFQWVNPHTWIQLLVTDEQSGEVTEWSIEGRSPNQLRRRGWSRTILSPGEQVTLTIYPLRRGGPVGAIVSVEKADGTIINADTPTAVDPDEEGSR